MRVAKLSELQPVQTGALLEPKYINIKDTAEYSSESQWVVKDKLRRGIYKARKSGRRTLIEFASVKSHLADLPAAKFAPPPRKSSRRGGR
jgi:hypothetical protein